MAQRRAARESRPPADAVVLRFTEDHEELEEHPQLVNEDPYHDGWLIELKLSDEAELDELISADEYEETVADEKV